MNHPSNSIVGFLDFLTAKQATDSYNLFMTTVLSSKGQPVSLKKGWDGLPIGTIWIRFDFFDNEENINQIFQSI